VTGGADDPDAPPLVVIRGEATAQEVAALVAVLQTVGAERAAREAAEEAARADSRPVSEWSAPRYRVRGSRTLPASAPGGWRASGLPH
jgi:hypothetical protein